MVAQTPRLPDPPRPLVTPDVQDVCFFGEKRPVFVRLHICLDRRGFRAAWNQRFEKRFRELDTDSNGVLSTEEAKGATRINSKTGSTILNSLLSKFTNEMAVVSLADTSPKDGKVTKQELRAYLRREQQGPFHTRGGQPGRRVSNGDSTSVSSRLFDRLDLDDDGKLSFSELAAARSTLEKSDINEDESISFVELNEGPQQNVYQGNGNKRAQAFVEFAPYGPNMASVNRLLDDYGKRTESAKTEKPKQGIPRETLGWTTDLFAQFDANSSELIEKEELQRFLKSPTPAIQFTIRMGAKRKGVPTIERHLGPQQYDVAVESRQLAGGVRFRHRSNRISRGGKRQFRQRQTDSLLQATVSVHRP